MSIPENIIPKLDKAIRQLLGAGWDCGKVRDALAANQSFGKYDGCTPMAIESRSRRICADMNKEVRQEFRRVMSHVSPETKWNFHKAVQSIIHK